MASEVIDARVSPVHAAAMTDSLTACDIPPVATVSRSTYFMADEAALVRQGARPVLGVADARVFRHGFNDQSAEIWSDDGVLLAVSHQVVWFKS
ncbi:MULTISPECIES: hypothetical protein [unclassified Phenylobacterium]|uniref:hypothetical protein n=1 Tax=unclassified Phenylobacterium TaxID=2640670 RepID=UPI003F4FFD6C